MNSVRALWKHQIFRLIVVILAIMTGITLLILLISLGYQADWTGFNRHMENLSSGQQDQPAKTLWDWMQLLIIPIVLAIGAFLLNFATTRTEQKIAAQRYKDDQKIAEQRYENDQKIALDKQREDLFQIYLDRMSELLLERGLRASQQDSEVRNVARVRTLTVLGQLDTTRQNAVLSFLREAKLVTPELGKSIVSLADAQLGHAKLSEVNFTRLDLSEVDLNKANLDGADFTGANLSKAWLLEANLTGAILIGANFTGANFTGAILTGAILIDADFTGADFTGADFTGAILSDADFTGAYLHEAIGVTQEQLSAAKTAI